MADNSYYTGGGPTYQASQMNAGQGPYGAPAGYNAWLDQQIAAQRQAGRAGTSTQGFQASDYSQPEQQQLQRDYTNYTNQTNAANQINKSFDSFQGPGGYYQQVYQNTLNPAMAQIQRQYGDASMHQGQAAADRGLIGGSQDVFQKSRLGDAATLATQNAETQAYQAQAGTQQQYEATRNQLLQQLYNPTAAGQASNQSYQSAIQGLVSGQGQLNQSMMNQANIQNNSQIQQSQVAGGLLNSAAGIVNASPYLNQGQPGMSSAFHGYSGHPQQQSGAQVGPTYSQAGTGGYGSSQFNYNPPSGSSSNGWGG